MKTATRKRKGEVIRWEEEDMRHEVERFIPHRRRQRDVISDDGKYVEVLTDNDAFLLDILLFDL